MRKFFLGFLLGCLLILPCTCSKPAPGYKVLTVYDTITQYLPTPADTVYLAKRIDVLLTDTLIKVSHDTTIISLPVTQLHYTDSLYEAWVSGYQPQLDSISIFSRTHYIQRQPEKFGADISATISRSPGIQAAGYYRRNNWKYSIGYQLTADFQSPYISVTYNLPYK